MTDKTVPPHEISQPSEAKSSKFFKRGGVSRPRAAKPKPKGEFAEKVLIRVAEGIRITASMRRAFEKKYNAEIIFIRLKNDANTPELRLKFIGTRQEEAERRTETARIELESLGADPSLASELAKIIEDFEAEPTTPTITEDMKPYIPRLLARAAAAAFQEAAPTARPERVLLSEPEDARIEKYRGKRVDGPVNDYLLASYPYRAGAPQLTRAFLASHDAQAHNAIYNQLDEAGRYALGLSDKAEPKDVFLERHNVDLESDTGRRDAIRLHGLLSSRLHPRAYRIK